MFFNSNKPMIVESDSRLFCFEEKKIIDEEECTYYAFNRECDKNGNILKRTHPHANKPCAYIIRGYPDIDGELYICKYCCEKNNPPKKKWLVPEEIHEYFK